MISRAIIKGFLKIFLISAGAFAGVVFVGVFFAFKELDDSPLLDQRLSERHGLLKCFRKLSSAEFGGFSECSEYAQFHYPMYPEFYAATPAKSACLVSKDILKVLRIDYPLNQDEINIAEERVKRNCAL